ncbi:glucuronate isomerase [Selenomonas sp. GACV-9]|uniref:glucuronate isomerase n=1 Tax=Selenomonas sp. GACV-9 TaxID=3158782 RepID=UPI0008EA9B85|nr:glucuronate isomerase [Selenomonas ruminantium]
MKKFMDENVLLQTETAQWLYHEHAAKMPIIDYRCHLSAAEIASDSSYRNITRLLLGSDDAKWRLMRAGGIEEKYITGDASDYEKFQKFAEVLPKAVGNPIFLRTQLELKRFFDCDTLLSGETAPEIWTLCNEKLQQPDFTIRGLLQKAGVESIDTLADPADDLKWFRKTLDDETCKTLVHPIFCPDKVLHIESPEWENYMKYELGTSADIDISTMQDIRDALRKRMDYFETLGCRTADHTLDMMDFCLAEEFELDDIVGRTINGKARRQTQTVRAQFQTAIMVFLATEYARRGWVMQLEYAVLRDNNSRLLNSAGPAKGGDCLTSGCCGAKLAQFLDALDKDSLLPKTIISSRNPADGPMIASVIGAFQGSEAAGKLQLGASWNFQGDKAGIKAQLANTAGLSLLGNAVNMASNARSVLSCSRHEYYRRILCNFIGRLVENGEYPDDRELLGKLVEDICYNNAKKYFG